MFGKSAPRLQQCFYQRQGDGDLEKNCLKCAHLSPPRIDGSQSTQSLNEMRLGSSVRPRPM